LNPGIRVRVLDILSDRAWFQLVKTELRKTGFELRTEIQLGCDPEERRLAHISAASVHLRLVVNVDQTTITTTPRASVASGPAAGVSIGGADAAGGAVGGGGGDVAVGGGGGGGDADGGDGGDYAEFLEASLMRLQYCDEEQLLEIRCRYQQLCCGERGVVNERPQVK